MCHFSRGESEWEGDWSDGSKLWTSEMMTKLVSRPAPIVQQTALINEKKHTFGNDGIFWISYKDFLQHFQSINRVRLFTKEWQVAQQWTCVNVPWTVDFLNTKFQFTVDKAGPVVVVLQQPDDRYFYGLRGRFLYSLHFRVHEQGKQDRWIVRSMHNSGNETVFTRSVSAEIEDLAPGTYDVLFKVTATRSLVSSTAEEAIFKYAVERKDKLLQVGRRFDYALTKGNLRSMEEVNKRQKKTYYREKQNTGFKRNRKLTQQEKARARKRKQRVDDAMREKRKAFEEQRREKARQRRERIAERRENESVEVQADRSTEDKSDSKGDNETPSTEDDQPDSQKTEKAVVPDESGTKSQPAEGAPEALSKSFSRLQLQNTRESRDTRGDVSPLEEDEYESPVEPPEELDDDDFDWDSDM